MATTRSPASSDLDHRTIFVSAPGITADKGFVGIADGSTTVYEANIDNTWVDSSTDVWAYLFDDVSNDLTPGTDRPDFGIPVPAGVAADNTKFAVGRVVMICLEGIPFTNGLTVLASKEDGNAMDAAPDNDITVALKVSA